MQAGRQMEWNERTQRKNAMNESKERGEHTERAQWTHAKNAINKRTQRKSTTHNERTQWAQFMHTAMSNVSMYGSSNTKMQIHHKHNKGAHIQRAEGIPITATSPPGLSKRAENRLFLPKIDFFFKKSRKFDRKIYTPGDEPNLLDQ